MIDLKRELKKALNSLPLDELMEVIYRSPFKIECSLKGFKNNKKTGINFIKNNVTQLEINFNFNGKVGFSIDKNTDKNVLKILIKEISDCTEDVGEKIYKEIVFTKHKLDSPISCHPYFQLVLAPSHAPRHAGFYGKNPAILEIAYNSCKNNTINLYRARKKIKENLLLLNLLLNGKMFLLDNKLKNDWVIVNATEQEIKYCTSNYYTIANFEHNATEFSDLSDDQKVQNDDPIDEYYSKEPNSFSGGLQAPNNLLTQVKKYHELNDDLKKYFLISLNWLYLFNLQQENSDSFAVISLANAIHALAKILKIRDDVALNNQDKEYFKKILMEFSNCDDNDAKAFYEEYRSRLFHGEMLESDQTVGFGVFLDPRFFNEALKIPGYEKLVKISLINWLEQSDKMYTLANKKVGLIQKILSKILPFTVTLEIRWRSQAGERF